MASAAVQFTALLSPVMVFGVTSPNISSSFSVLIRCSSCTVRLSSSGCFSTVFTRHTMPSPGSSMSCSQSPTMISGTSGPMAMLAWLCRSHSVRGMLSGLNRPASCRLCPFSLLIIPTAPSRSLSRSRPRRLHS